MKLVYIEWCDAMVNSSPWISLEEANDWSETQNWIISQVGFLLKETPEFILLASKKSCYDKENPDVGGLIKIPTTWIRKRVDLTQHIN
jgi:hypothetical protein